MSDTLSIYIHWPFCLAKCPYCDFNSHVLNKVDHILWLNSYKQELHYFKDIINKKYIKSIFFGGGTPSLMDPFVVAGIIDTISSLATIDYNTEITLETNPTSFEIEKFTGFKLAGVNRVSIGVQSLIDDDLKDLGRQHNAHQAIKTIEIAKTIFPRVSFDLIYARSGQNLKNWQLELQSAIPLSFGHISLYQLSIEKGTLFYKLFNKGSLILPDTDETADMYEWTNSYLQSQGYVQYEISNYAMKNHECKHNLTYWCYDTYLGIGPGAHSRVMMSYQSVFALHSIMMWYKPEKWLQSINDFSCAIQSINKLSPQDIVSEMLMMGLRLKEGVNVSVLEQKTNQKLENIINIEVVEYYSSLGLLEYYADTHNAYTLRLTNKGLMLHNYLVPRLLKI